MTEREILLHCLARIAARLQLNRRLRELGWTACGLFGLLTAYEILEAVIDSAAVMAGLAPLFVLAALAVVARFAVRLMQQPTLAQAAGAADSRADLKDELKSAYWFVLQAGTTPAIDLVLRHAAYTAHRIDPRRLFPLVVPRSVFAAVLLALTAGTLAWLSPRLTYPEAADLHEGALAEGSSRSATDALGLQRPAQDERPALATDGMPAPARGSRTDDAAWSQVEQLTRGLEPGPGLDPIQRAVDAHDARRALRLLESLPSAHKASGPSAQLEGEQMSAELAAGIIRRLQEMLQQNGDAEPNADPRASAGPVARVAQEPGEQPDDEQQGDNPGRHSAAEDALNAVLRAISRGGTGGREAVQAEGQGGQQSGLTNASGGAMGRRVGVSQAGAGDTQPPKGNPAGDAPSDPVLGKPTQRLAAQLQRVRVEHNDSEQDEGTPGAFYAATRAQAARLDYQTVTARQRATNEESMDAEQMPLAYRAAVKKYFLVEHAKEK
jgi:hypothetical protein